jgi:hypothetical protein
MRNDSHSTFVRLLQTSVCSDYFHLYSFNLLAALIGDELMRKMISQYTRMISFASHWSRALRLVTKHDAVIRCTGIAAGFSHLRWGVPLNHKREAGCT